MESILDAINEWIKEILIGAINGNLSTMFGDVNEKVGTIAAEVGKTPQGWNANIFNMIQNLSENVIVPIAGLVITYVLCYELISMVTEKNNMHDVDTFMFFKWFFKAFVAVFLVTHTFDITMAVFDMAQHIVSGAAGVIGGDTNIDVTEALAAMQEGLKDMLIVQDQIWNRVTINRAEKKSTRYYMDEFHLLLKEEQTAAYSVEIWKRFRKWGGIPTAITQNIKDLLASREVENIFENSDFVLMLNQAQGDRAILAKQLNISPQQMKYVTHTEAGEGLIFYGNVVLPFVDHFPKDTELYRIMTTKPEEVSSL